MRATFREVFSGLSLLWKWITRELVYTDLATMLTADFLSDFKRATEANWSERSINSLLYGFQFQRGTRWNPGLSVQQIAEYERALEVGLPHDFRSFLRGMNGTDLPTLNVYGNSGEPQRQGVGVYSYPRDIEIVTWRMKETNVRREEIAINLANQGFELPADAKLIPIYGHRYVICTSNLNNSVVLSIVNLDVSEFLKEIDAIVYANSLMEYLEIEFLQDTRDGPVES
jgi:hypothetical protein